MPKVFPFFVEFCWNPLIFTLRNRHEQSPKHILMPSPSTFISLSYPFHSSSALTHKPSRFSPIQHFFQSYARDRKTVQPISENLPILFSVPPIKLHFLSPVDIFHISLSLFLFHFGSKLRSQLVLRVQNILCHSNLEVSLYVNQITSLSKCSKIKAVIAIKKV